MRILAIDYGRKRTGMAISDESGIAITNLDIVDMTRQDAFEQVVQTIEKLNPGVVVIGKPVTLDGHESVLQKEIDQFEKALKKRFNSLKFIQWDETYTSQMAQTTLQQIQGSKKTSRQRRNKNKQKLDSLAAHFILRSYLDALHQGL